MKKKAIVCVGGTAGHLIPAQETADSLLKEGWDVLFLGKGLQANPFFDNEKFKFKEIPSATIQSKNPFKIIKSCFSLLSGSFKALRCIRKIRPDVILGFGSYHSLPGLLVGILYRIPLVLHEQNIVPGKVNRLIAPFSKGIGVMFPESLLKLPIPVQAVSTKSELKINTASTDTNYSVLSADRFTVLVFGGSQGSEFLNRFLLAIFPEFYKLRPDLQIIHLVGKSEVMHQEVSFLYRKLNIPHVVKYFESDMSVPVGIADVAICRAGAGTVRLLIDYELPALLIPYPGAYGHQDKNAEFFTKIVGGGIFLTQNQLQKEHFIESLKDLTSEKNLNKKKQNLSNYRKTKLVIPFVDFIDDLLARIPLKR